MKVKEQLHTERYSIYNSDCMEVVPTLDNGSVDLAIYSPPLLIYILILAVKEI